MPSPPFGRFADWLRLILSALILSILSELTVVVNAQHVDFNRCWNETISRLNTSDTSDPNQCFMWDKTRQNRISTNIPFVTLNGCDNLCGSGYELWPVTDTLKRLALFILPLIVLALRFAYAQVGIGNVILIFVHLLGDPLDSLWSLLTRQELARRNYNLAMEIAPTAAKDVATIWTAYDQWWQDPTEHFRNSLSERMGCKQRRREVEPSARTPNSPRWSPLPNCILDWWHKSSSQTISIRGSCGSWWESLRRCVSVQQDNSIQQDNPAQHNSSIQRSTYVPGVLEGSEVLIIKKVSRNLANNREGKLLSTWITIIIFLISLTIAYVRSATEEINNQTAHTIAVVMLFSHLVFAVYVSGHVGNFKDPDSVLVEISKLSYKLPDLFPPIRFARNYEITDEDITSRYYKVAPWVGINNSWRPTKTLRPYDASSDRSPGKLLGICLGVLGGSWLAAFLVSFFTPVVGVGCRSFGWSMIALGWVLSVIFDSLFGFLSEPKSLWYTALVKDGIFMAGNITTVLLAQFGVMNTCFCRASVFLNRKNQNNACINLGPVTNAEKQAGWREWVIIPICGLVVVLLGVFIAGYEGEHGRLLFHRASGERHAELIAIKNLDVLFSVDAAEEGPSRVSESSAPNPRYFNRFAPEASESSSRNIPTSTFQTNENSERTSLEGGPPESYEMDSLLRNGGERMK